VNERVQRRTQKDLPLQAILLELDGILDSWIFDRFPKYDSTSTNHFRIWKFWVPFVVAVLFLREEHHLRLRDSVAANKGKHLGCSQVIGLQSHENVSSRRRMEGKGSTFLMIADSFFESYDHVLCGGISFCLDIFLRCQCWKMLDSLCSKCWSLIYSLEVRSHGGRGFQWNFATFEDHPAIRLLTTPSSANCERPSKCDMIFVTWFRCHGQHHTHVPWFVGEILAIARDNSTFWQFYRSPDLWWEKWYRPDIACVHTHEEIHQWQYADTNKGRAWWALMTSWIVKPSRARVQSEFRQSQFIDLPT
jgi:hypothetical protein